MPFNYISGKYTLPNLRMPKSTLIRQALQTGIFFIEMLGRCNKTEQLVVTRLSNWMQRRNEAI